MKTMFKKAVPALLAAVALIVPSSAIAHGSVWTTSVKTATAADGGGIVVTTSKTSYLASNHGYVIAYTEANGLSDHGMINYKALPGSYRNQASFTLDRLLSEGDTGVQTHATCQGSSGDAAKLWIPANIAAWQSQTPSTPAGSEPFWNYIPWQNTGAGLGDGAEVATWVAEVKELTGVDLAAASDLSAACAGIGGTYKAADTVASTTASLTSGYSADISKPLNDQISSLTADKATLTGQLSGLQADLAAANSAKSAALSAKATAESAASTAVATKNAALADVARLSRTLSASTAGATLAGSVAASTGAPVSVSGPGGLAVTINLVISQAKATALHLSSTTIGTATATIGAGGTVSKTVALSSAAKTKVKKLSANLGVTIQVSGSDRAAAKGWTFTK
ncbi:MAG: hypothetical protein NTX07_09550 [Solirubrobacterales bacterium]|nr:hypothetical protein [Solirubrobacterales bacterium]